MNQVVPKSPGRIVTQEKQRREICKNLIIFLFSKVPPSNLRLVVVV